MAIFSIALYGYLHTTIYGAIQDKLRYHAKHILQSPIHYNLNQSFYIQSTNPLEKDTLHIEILPKSSVQINETFIASNNHTKYALITQYHNAILKITDDISQESYFLDSVLKGIVLVDFFIIILILLFSLAFSNILYKPIDKLSTTLSRLKENDLELLEERELPVEFHPLVLSINNLLARIKNYFNGQKQLFIGIAHELKTPLAVVKTKCEVTLIKEREKEVYIGVLKENIQSINEMNAIIKTLLDLGRQESAQFEKTSLVNIAKILQNLADNFKILSQKEGKNFTYDSKIPHLEIKIKPTLLTQIVQNFLQNALKFTPKGKSVHLTSTLIHNEILRISVIDEGCGIDSTLEDIYAPFKRAGNKSGAGLGLFLAKSAATALGGSIALKNRSDTKGSIATFELKINRLK